jgi:hypothetical protein
MAVKAKKTPTESVINAKTFQTQLGSLANTLALKVQREAVKVVNPGFVATDIYVMLRQSLSIYHLIFHLNADERREKEAAWTVYSAAALPLVRCMIDSLYNITAILTNPRVKGRQFRASGYRQILDGLDADEKRYGGDTTWDEYIAGRRKSTDFDMRTNNVTMAEVQAVKRWPTLGAYLRVKKNTPLTPHQEFLKNLTFGFWREYSSMAHVTFQGLIPTAVFFTTSDIPHEERPQFEDFSDRMISMHIFRVAAILLCTLTEIQAHFRFDGARINERLHEIWNALTPAFEVKELYDLRYAKLMKDKGIGPY